MNRKLAIKRELKSKFFWISVAITIPFGLTFYFKELQILQIIYGSLILSSIPLMASTSFSPELAANFVKFHKRFYGKKGTYTRLPNDVKFSIWKSSLRTMSYLFALIYAVLDWSGTTELFLGNPNKVVGLLGLGIMALIVASIFEVSIHLLKKYGQIFENSKDGTRFNLGEELHRKLDYVISPVALISFTHIILAKSFNLNLVFGVMLALVVSSFYSTTISFLLLRRKKLYDKLMTKLERLIERTKQ